MKWFLLFIEGEGLRHANKIRAKDKESATKLVIDNGLVNPEIERFHIEEIK